MTPVVILAQVEPIIKHDQMHTMNVIQRDFAILGTKKGVQNAAGKYQRPVVGLIHFRVHRHLSIWKAFSDTGISITTTLVCLPLFYSPPHALWKLDSLSTAYEGVAWFSTVALTAQWKSMADKEERNQACRLCDVDDLWPASASWNQRSQWQWLPDLHGLENN